MKLEYERQVSQNKTEKKKKTESPELRMDEFYKIMGEFYSGAPRHVSPTRRLIEQKHAAFRHKE